MDQPMIACTAEEADVLATIKCWPGVPAVVTFCPDKGWTVSTAQEDAHLHYQDTGLFDRALIDAEYARLGYSKGWTFLMCPESRMTTAEIAIVGLNPGGGGDSDDYRYGGDWDCSQGNAYFRPWDAGSNTTPMQWQVQEWHRIAGVSEDSTFCAQFVPFRSPDWERLGNFGEALNFSRRLWRWVLARSPARTLIVMGRVAGGELERLLECASPSLYDTGWGDMKIRLAKNAKGQRVITMPHPSRYFLFGRGAPSTIARSSLQQALIA